jgi:pimeloyl-ACP methyl ester carboxylesterase
MTDIRRDNSIIQRPDWLPERVWPYRIRTVVVDGETIAYTDEGRGPVLLLVNDGMWSFVWNQLIERLTDGFRVVTLDFPDSGLSPDNGRAPSLRGDAAILEAVARELGLDHVTLVAHDLGGPVGLGPAMHRPELVVGFAFINTFAWPPHRASLRAMLGIVSSTPVTALDVSTNVIPRLTATRFGVGRNLDAAGRAAFLGPFRRRGPRKRFHAVMGAPRTEVGYLVEVEDALRTTLADKPVLTIYGERNDPFGFQARFKELFPAAAELVIPRGNHFPMMDDPDLVAETIATWHGRAIGG